jgi:hypothetical protein
MTRFDPVPEHVTEQARRAAEGRAPADSRLLELVNDSLLDIPLGVSRSGESVRVVSFTGDGVRLDARLEGGEAGSTLLGSIAPVRARTVDLHTENSLTMLPVEPDGTFRARDLPHGPVRLHIEIDVDGTPRHFHSSWFNC